MAKNTVNEVGALSESQIHKLRTMDRDWAAAIELVVHEFGMSDVEWALQQMELGFRKKAVLYGL